MLSTLGLSESYTNIITKKLRKTLKATAGSQNLYIGTLHQLSESARAHARSIAAHGCYSGVYDNINLMFRVAEQVIGRHGTSLFFLTLKYK